MPNVVRVYVGTGCGPCGPIKAMINNGQVESDIPDAEIEFVDVTTEEGFAEIEKEGLEKVPSAKFEGQFCKLEIDKERSVVVISCGE